jgi:hypothetical protein
VRTSPKTAALIGRTATKEESDGIPWRLVHRDLPAGILSTKDALDDGNAYDSAIEAAADGRITRQATIVKTYMLLTSELLAKAR